MILAPLIHRISCLARLCLDIARMPVAHLRFRTAAHPEHIQAVYHYFTKPHPRYKVFANKGLGAALIHLRAFGSAQDFIASLRHCGRAAAERRKAAARGYRLDEIERNALVEEIHQVNVSCETRQGRPMDRDYLEKQLHYDDLGHFRYYGLFDRNGALVAYCNVGVFGNFAMADRVLGVRSNDGAMFLLLTEITCRLIQDGQVDYFMYDMVFGARPGLRAFKRRLGFQPYRARYSIE